MWAQAQLEALAITEIAFRLVAAMGITLDATLPTGERIGLVETSVPPSRPRCEGGLISAGTVSDWPRNDELITKQLSGSV